MVLLAESASWATQLFFGSVLLIIGVFLILIVLVQRGRGGGLTGALGGMGGQSAFGAKAGDLFTRITMVTAAVWILFSMISIKMLQVPDPLGTNVSSGTNLLSPEVPEGENPDNAAPTDQLPAATTPENSSALPAENSGKTTPEAPATTNP
jgi:preprotein translocase subunit SecG